MTTQPTPKMIDAMRAIQRTKNFALKVGWERWQVNPSIAQGLIKRGFAEMVTGKFPPSHSWQQVIKLTDAGRDYLRELWVKNGTNPQAEEGN